MKRYIYLALLFLQLSSLLATEQLLIDIKKDSFNVYDKLVIRFINENMSYDELFECCQNEIGSQSIYENAEDFAYDVYSNAEIRKSGGVTKSSSISSFSVTSLFLSYKHDIYRNYLSVKRFFVKSKDLQGNLGKLAKHEITTTEVNVVNTAVLSSMLIMNLADFLFAGITGSALSAGLLICLGGAVGAGGAGFGIWWLMNYLNMTWLLPALASTYASITTAMSGNFSPLSIGGAVLIGPSTYMLQQNYKGYNKLSAVISVYATFQLYYFYQKRYVQAYIKKKVDEKKNKELVKELSALQKVKKALLTPLPK